MECGRKLIYFSTYENGAKSKKAGYAAIFVRGELCEVQMYYRGPESGEGVNIQPVYVFLDGTVVLGEEIAVEEGMAAVAFQTGRSDFLQSGRSLEELETVYLDGVKECICGGRLDGQELEDAAYTLTDWVEEENAPQAVMQEEETHLEEMLLHGKEPEPERWSLPQCLERFPEMKLPYDGMRRRCCRMELEELGHLPEKWHGLKENHFLLHGYYEYHHLLFAKLNCRYGERYALGVPGEFCYRNQYMAENFGFFDFAPLEPGRRRGGSFGYWYYYLE